jgi:hypothetical protein
MYYFLILISIQKNMMMYIKVVQLIVPEPGSLKNLSIFLTNL